MDATAATRSDAPFGIREMVPSDVDAVVALLHRMRADGEPYPPSVDTSGADGLRRWLLDGTALVRLVALDDGDVIGHGQLVEPHEYLTSRAGGMRDARPPSSWVEMSKLFVDVAHRHHGVGAQLVAALRRHADALGRTMVLASLSAGASAFYETLGFDRIGGFEGRHGHNSVLQDARGRTAGAGAS